MGPGYIDFVAEHCFIEITLTKIMLVQTNEIIKKVSEHFTNLLPLIFH